MLSEKWDSVNQNLKLYRIKKIYIYQNFAVMSLPKIATRGNSGPLLSLNTSLKLTGSKLRLTIRNDEINVSVIFVNETTIVARS